MGVAWNGARENRIVFPANRTVAVGLGTNSIAYSSDGITWTGLGTSIFTAGQDVAFGWPAGGTRWVAVGITWTGLGTTIFTIRGHGVAWNGGRGSVDMSTITLDEYGVGLSNRLDVVNDKYYNQGFQEMALTINV